MLLVHLVTTKATNETQLRRLITKKEKKLITVLGKLLPLTGRKAGLLQSEILRTPRPPLPMAHSIVSSSCMLG